MSSGIDQRKVVAYKKCPDCGFTRMKVFSCGSFHCGKCLSGGMISCETHRYLLEDNEIKKKVTNEYVFRTFVCEKCRAIIEKLPCKWCKKSSEIK